MSSTNATFVNSYQFKAWLNSDEVFDLASGFDWPTPETSSLWWNFIKEYQPASETIWKYVNKQLSVNWFSEYKPVAGTFVKLWNDGENFTQVLSSCGEQIGSINYRCNLLKQGLYHVKINATTNYLDVTFWGAGTKPFENASS